MRYHRAATSWYCFLLLSPLLSILLCIPRAHREVAMFIGVTASATLVVSITVVPESAVRFHHGLAWLTCIQLGALLVCLDVVWRKESLPRFSERGRVIP